MFNHLPVAWMVWDCFPATILGPSARGRARRIFVKGEVSIILGSGCPGGRGNPFPRPPSTL